jgi:hypothetical protein
MQIRRLTTQLLLLSLYAQAVSFGHQSAEGPKKLNITIVEGEGAVNNIRQRVAREPMVQVEDENRKPIGGAVVTFLLPNQGASGAFANGARSLTVITNDKGQAVANGFRANNSAGQYQMRVTASNQGQTASISINMSNAAVAGVAAGAGLSTAKWLLILGAVGGAVAGGYVAATNGDNGGSGSSPTTVTPGTPTVGPPR